MDIAKFIRTRIGTDWKQPSSFLGSMAVRKILNSASANPGYDEKLPFVTEWMIEFDSEGWPGREIGFDKDNEIVIAGPDTLNYGFWLDSDMKIDDFAGEEVASDEFERYWESAKKRGILNGTI